MRTFKTSAITCLVAFATNLSAAALAAPSEGQSLFGEPAPEAQVVADLEQHMFNLINKDRASAGVTPVRFDPTLNKLARDYAEYMLKKGFFAHVDPKGRNPQTRADESGVRAGVYENLSVEFRKQGSDFRFVEEAQRDMMSEPPNQKNHRSNILLPEHKHVGVGVARSKKKLIMVQEYTDSTPTEPEPR